MKRIVLNYTEAGDLIDYALVSVGKIVLVSEQMGREILREEYENMQAVIEESSFVDFMDADTITTMLAHSMSFTKHEETCHGRIQTHRLVA